MENVKKFIKPGFYITVGFFNFIWLLLNHLTAYAKYKGVSYDDKVSNGLKFIGKDLGGDAEIFKAFASIALVFVVLSTLAILFIGVIKLLEALNVNVSFITGNKTVNKVFEIVASLVLLVNLCACGTDFICVHLYSLANVDSAWGIVVGYRAGVGCWFLSLWAAGAFFVSKFVINKITADSSNVASNGQNACESNSSGYVCTVCGKAAYADSKFCPYCGGAVAEVVPEAPAQPVCPVCGKPIDEDAKFCASCGASVGVTETAEDTTENV